MNQPDYKNYTNTIRQKQAPPTKKQLERVYEYIEHPAIQPFLDKLTGDLDRNLKTRGGTGALLGWMKAKIADHDKRHPLAFNPSWQDGLS
jgi:hypothetical protein